MKSFSILAAAVALAGLVAAVPTHKTYYESNGNYYNNSELDVEVDIQIDVNTVFYRNGNYYNYRNQEIDQVDIQIDATIIIEESDDSHHHGHSNSKRGGHPTYYYYDGQYHNSDSEVVEVQIDIEIAVFFRDGKYYNSRGREIEEVDIQVDATIIIDSMPSHNGHGHNSMSKRGSHPTYYYYDGQYHNSDSEVVEVTIDIDIAVFFRDGKYYNSRGSEIAEVDIQVDATIIIDSMPSHHHGHNSMSKRDSHPTYYYYDGEYHNSDSEVVEVQIDIEIAVFFRNGKYYNSRGSEIAEVDIQVDATIIIDSMPSHNGHGHGHSN